MTGRGRRRLAVVLVLVAVLLAAAGVAATPAAASITYSVTATIGVGNYPATAGGGRNNTLQYYWATPGSPWYNTQIAGPGTTYSG